MNTTASAQRPRFDSAEVMWAGAAAVDRSGFSTRLRVANDALFEEFFAHPFLAGLRDGSLPSDVAVHYVGQDHQYLTAFARCYGLAISMSPDREWIEFLSDQVQFLLNDEVHPHQVLCRAAGVRYADAQVDRLAPNAQAYINHMTVSAHDSLAVLIAALMPCVWTYIWAASRQQLLDPVSPNNPYAGWWEFYATPDCHALLAEFANRLDQLAELAGPAERARMERAFTDSTRYEIGFWQMAWTKQTWD